MERSEPKLGSGEPGPGTERPIRYQTSGQPIVVYGAQLQVDPAEIRQLAQLLAGCLKGIQLVTAGSDQLGQKLHSVNLLSAYRSPQVQVACQQNTQLTQALSQLLQQGQQLVYHLQQAAQQYRLAEVQAAALAPGLGLIPFSADPINAGIVLSFAPLLYWPQLFNDLGTNAFSLQIVGMQQGQQLAENGVRRLGQIVPLASQLDRWFNAGLRNLRPLLPGSFIPGPGLKAMEMHPFTNLIFGTQALLQTAGGLFHRSQLPLRKAKRTWEADLFEVNPARLLSAAITQWGGIKLQPLLVGKDCRYLERDTKVPQSVEQVVQQIEDVEAGGRSGKIRVTKYETDGKIAWSVAIPGTQQFLSQTNVQDFYSNFRANAGLDTDLVRGVEQALQQAGYQPGQPVELTGHSLGGATAARFASDPYLVKKYNVKSVVEIGGNVGTPRPAPGVHMVAIENRYDLVPKLDGRPTPFRNNLTTVVGNHFAWGLETHDQKIYQQIAREWQSSADPNYQRFWQARQRNLGLNQHTKAISTNFYIERDLKVPAQNRRFEPGTCAVPAP